MNRLCYIAKPREFESPKGLLIRTAFFNGYNTVNDLCHDFNVQKPKDNNWLLTKDSDFLKTLIEECPEYESSLSSAFYLPWSKAATDASSTSYSFPYNAIQRYFCFCPECLKQEMFTVFQDLEQISACPIHKNKIIVYCPNCGGREFWNNANLIYCKCGFLRKEAFPEPVKWIRDQTLNIFDPDYRACDLRHLSFIVDSCKQLWDERKNPNNPTTFETHKELHKQIDRMVTEQILRYPGFTLNMHLAPWAVQGQSLYSLAREILSARVNPCYLCDSAICCSGVRLTAQQFQFCIKNRSYPELKRIIMKNLTREPRERGDFQYYTSAMPICEFIKQINSTDLCLATESKLENLDYIGTTEASVLLNCARGTVSWLADQGFLKKEPTAKIRGSGHKILIQKQSIAEFNRLFILVGEISAALNVSPFDAVTITNIVQIPPTHSFRGPYVFARKDIEESMEALRTVARERHPHQAFNDSQTTTSTGERSLPYRLRESQFTNINKLVNTTRHCPTCEGPHFRKNQLPRILNATPRLIEYRFFRSGLIHPHIVGNISYCSRKDISFMMDHLQQHVSLAQAARIIQCSLIKLNKLINTFNINPSFKITFANQEIQYLYLRSDIMTIKLGAPNQR
ncbi:helix-turn-helix domain-containing protein [Pseudomonas fluorescens]|uniref:helix-turn-helix domain-containing protein n=1 Tax=Pseudomonas fluorescens TaxID=294 RepID=UPI001AA0090A|nr:helix-turn-helix domain-containing protein [Pseudomonas fluorescens]QTD31738.1 helix-turn-helix domain-containing protein [Pseudomonas fluorescens]